MTVSPQTSILLEQACFAIQQRDWFSLSQQFNQLSSLLPPTLTPEDWNEESELHHFLLTALDVLESGDFYDRWEFAKLLPLVGESVVPSLVAILQDETAEWETRWFAARILTNFQTPLVLETLVQLLTQPTSEGEGDLQEIAIEALANMGEVALPALISLLPNAHFRLTIVRILAQMRCPEVVEPLLQAAHGSAPESRVLAIAALGRFHDPRVLPILQAALQDPIASVRREAVIALGLRGNQDTAETIVQQLGDRLRDPDEAVGQQAALALSRYQSQFAATTLFQALTQPDTPVALQIEVVRALGWLNIPFALECLYKRFTNLEGVELSTPVRREIITVLGRVNHPDLKSRAVNILLEVLRSNPRDQDRETRQIIIVGLGQLGDPRSIEDLIALLADPDPGIQLHAIAALQQIDALRAYQQLETLARSKAISDSLRQGIFKALQEWSRASA
ncbi:MAG: HEAT repeat domain-containing protein [Leptolyngbyaceae cyanobacterium bins.59]|nr:HEAT repeat domain-containing protein [Leptolyngbyaceae cyanobacterium bins.59]